jgi:hypothetical protein
MSYRTNFQPAVAAEIEDRQQADRFRRNRKDLLASVVISAELARERLEEQREKELARILAEITAKIIARILEIKIKEEIYLFVFQTRSASLHSAILLVEREIEP